MVGVTGYCGTNTQIIFLKKQSTKLWYSTIEEIPDEVKILVYRLKCWLFLKTLSH